VSYRLDEWGDGRGPSRAELWRTSSKRNGLTLSQRGPAFSVHSSSLRLEKTKQVDRSVGNAAQSVNPAICKFRRSLPNFYHAIGASRRHL